MSNPISKELFAEFSKHFSEYEAPAEPVRPWVGLTDEEICAEAMKKDQQSIGFIKGAEWAEAKLKEKNT